MNADDRLILARTVYGEARGEIPLGKQAVAHVVMNRVATPSWWGNSIKTVCLKPWQFSCWNQNDPNRAKLLSVGADDQDFLNCLAAVDAAVKAPVDPTKGATHYHTKAILPHWAKGRTPVADIGHHLFYVLKPSE